jgi:hypothetical protein
VRDKGTGTVSQSFGGSGDLGARDMGTVLKYYSKLVGKDEDVGTVLMSHSGVQIMGEWVSVPRNFTKIDRIIDY